MARVRVKRLDIVLTTNSPGEVSAWLAPALRALRRRAPAAVISVFIPPCTFASGSERSVVAALPEVNAVYGPLEFLRYALLGWKPRDFDPGAQGVVCFLGGDLIYGAWLARRLRYPAVAYTEGRAHWTKAYSLFLVPDKAARERAVRSGASPHQVVVVGDLMLDAVQPTSENEATARALLGVAENVDVISLFPGSRPLEFRIMLPFLMRTAEMLQRSHGRRLHFLLSLSPFIRAEVLRTVADKADVGVEPAEPPTDSAVKSAWMLTTSDVTVYAYQGLQYDLMQASDLAITVPGSNTAEMAHLGLPMIVVLPLNRPEDIPLEGLPGLIGNLPLFGPALKRAAVLKAVERVEYAALPNRKAGEFLVPEVRGFIQPEDVAVPVLELLDSQEKRQAVGRRLAEVMGGAGAADRLADAAMTAGG
jgi:hypothetical protein